MAVVNSATVIFGAKLTVIFLNFEFKTASFMFKTLPTHPQSHFQQLSSLTQRQQRPGNNHKEHNSKKSVNGSGEQCNSDFWRQTSRYR